MEGGAAEVKTGAYFFAESLVGQTIKDITSSDGGVVLGMQSGLRAKIRQTHRTDLGGERIVGFELQFPKSPKAITLSFASGRRAVIEI